MNRMLCVLISVSVMLMTGCSDSGKGFTGSTDGAPAGGAGSGGGSGGGGSGGGSGGGNPGSLGEATLIYAEDPGNTGFDDIAFNDAGTIAVFIMSTDPLGTNPGGDDQLFSVTVGQATPVQITSGSGGGFRSTDDFDINGAGTEVVFVSDQDLTGDNATNTLNVFRAATDGSSVTQVTSLTSGSVAEPGISGDGSTIVFTSADDLTGGNPMNDTQIFSIAPDGSNLTQVTTGETAAASVRISDNGTRLVYVDTSDPFGTNADGSGEIFAINIDGTNHMQLTMSDGDSQTPRISDDGAYIVFASAAEFSAGSNPDGQLEVYVANGDGTGLVRITNTDDSSGLIINRTAPAVDISGDGQWIAFMSYADLYGINTDHTYTIYWANRQGTQIQQLLRVETKPDGVSSRAARMPRLSNDGSTILFGALAPYATGAPDSGWKIFTSSRL